MNDSLLKASGTNIALPKVSYFGGGGGSWLSFLGGGE